MTTWAESLYWTARELLVPGLENSQYAYATRLRNVLNRAERWLDVGCGHNIVPEWLAGTVPPLDLAGRLVVGLDADRRALERHQQLSLRIEGDAEAMPFGAGTFELVTANMVLEHVRHPRRLFEEVARLLTPNGRFIVHTPNALGYTTALARLVPSSLRGTVARLLHGRRPEDVYPTYYRANVPATLHRLAARSGLQVDSIELVQTSPQLIAIAPLMLGEMMLIRALSSERLSRFRACLIAEFRKPLEAI